MPPVQRQTPNQNSKAMIGGPKTGNLLSAAIEVTKLNRAPIKLVIYGQNRVGKTTLACQFQKPLLLLSFEPNRTGGANSVKKTEGVRQIIFKYKPEEGDLPNTLYGTEKAKELVKELAIDTHFKTIVIDSATSYQDLFLQEILQVDKLPEQMSFGGVSGDAYRERSEKVKEGLRPFLNLNKDVIITAKEKDHNPPREEKVNPRTGKTQPDMRAKFLRGMNIESYVASDLGGAAVSWLHDTCDFIGRLYLAKEVKVTTDVRKIGNKEIVTENEEETGRLTHRIRTLYHPNFAAGFRSPDPDAIPEYVEGYTPKELHDNLMKVIEGIR